MIKFTPVEPYFYTIRKASTRRKTTRTYKRVFALSKQMGNAMQVNFIKGIKTFKSKISDAELFSAWRTGRYQSVLQVLPWDDLEKDLSGASRAIGDAARSSSRFTLMSLPAPVKSELRYDLNNPDIQSFIANRSSALVTNVTEDTKNIINQAISRSFDQALTPRDVALQIKGSIGLTPKYEQAVQNYRMGLIQADKSQAQVETLTARYQNQLLTARAMTIARTETRMAANQGQLAIWRNASEQGLIDGDTARKVWIVDGDPCEICEPMDGIDVALDEQWEVEYPDGSVELLDVPTESHPNCMCGMELEFGQPSEDQEVETIEEESTQDEEDTSEDSGA